MTKPDKAALRAELRAARDGFILNLAPGERARRESRAAAYLAPWIDGASCVAFYHAIGSELDCGAAITAAVARGITVALPHVEDRDSAMRFLAWTPGNPLETGWRGLIQPRVDAPEVEPDIIVAPLLGFDSALARLGQGAGFYDRAFAALPDVKKFGLCWSIQQRPVIACDPWDVPLDAVVTEAGVIEGSGTG
ncbi:5-formyltetrahydrofolate cyclo-ligase [Sphingomonas sp. SRS2]|uniref:5-formyltetrahydrofolate cyclo-ligase n=1 Tax=Sphingomonas sp. SRS2 TaxID=133190 RepID=UPI00061842BA|nr:5-formyltetrahydrofolate cyclo-ligase [Sphingomonas sp. SRS2]KKC25521.1 hypothetical protein WP12_13705 [Sphingomonas sp. SRS2]